MTTYIGYHSLLDTGTIVASTEAAGFEKENCYDHNTIDWWKPTSVPAYLTADMTSADTCDYFFLASHNLYDVSGTVVLQYSTDNFAADINDAFTPVTPTDNTSIFRSFASLSKRYWRVKVTTGIASLGFILFGDRWELPNGMPIGWKLIHQSRNAKVTNNITVTNERSGSTEISRSGNGQIPIRHMTNAVMRANWPVFADHVITKPFALQWDDTNYPDESLLCWVMGGKIPTPAYDTQTLLSATLTVEAQV